MLENKSARNDANKALTPFEQKNDSFFYPADDLACVNSLKELEEDPALMPCEPLIDEKSILLHGETCFYGIRFVRIGQVLFFPKAKIEGSIGAQVLVDFEYGQMLGEIISIIEKKDLASNIEIGEGSIIALATAQDIATHTENRLLAAEAEAFCKSCIRQRSLDMKLVGVEVLHDKSKIIFFFTAPTRIDFRELVKDLVRNYKTRIELRQIGVRHETQMLGGLGSCGMVCCCHRYLRKFAPVTIKMAKEQNLFLNPAKLSGLCGRLLCCLSFEQASYKEFNRRAPKIGKRYVINNEPVRVARVNMFSRSVTGITDANVEIVYSLEEWEEVAPKKHEVAFEQKRGISYHENSENTHGTPSAPNPPSILNTFGTSHSKGADASSQDKKIPPAGTNGTN